MADTPNAYPIRKLSFEIDESFERYRHRTSARLGEQDSLGSAILRIWNKLDQTLPLQASNQRLTRLSGYPQSASQLGGTGPLRIEKREDHRLRGCELRQSMGGELAPQGIVKPSEPIQKKASKIHGIVSIADELYSIDNRQIP